MPDGLQADILFHPNNQLLYLVSVLLWTKLVGALGLSLSDPLGFVLAVGAMNCFAAAGCVAILFYVIMRVSSSRELAATICLGYGLTTAFLEQAVNPDEPMVGAFWSFLAISRVILSINNQRLWPLILAGMFFALAMATYRSMVLIAPARPWRWQRFPDVRLAVGR